MDPKRYDQNKSIGNSRTFDHDLTLWDELRRALYRLCVKTGERIRKEGEAAGRVSVSLKDHEFVTSSHSRTLMNPTDATEEIYRIAKELLEELWDQEPVRLLGVSLEMLEKKNRMQMSLFGDENQEELQEILDGLKKKYGSDSILRGRKLKGWCTFLLLCIKTDRMLV